MRYFCMLNILRIKSNQFFYIYVRSKADKSYTRVNKKNNVKTKTIKLLSSKENMFIVVLAATISMT